MTNAERDLGGMQRGQQIICELVTGSREAAAPSTAVVNRIVEVSGHGPGERAVSPECLRPQASPRRFRRSGWNGSGPAEGAAGRGWVERIPRAAPWVRVQVGTGQPGPALEARGRGRKSLPSVEVGGPLA